MDKEKILRKWLELKFSRVAEMDRSRDNLPKEFSSAICELDYVFQLEKTIDDYDDFILEIAGFPSIIIEEVSWWLVDGSSLVSKNGSTTITTLEGEEADDIEHILKSEEDFIEFLVAEYCVEE